MSPFSDTPALLETDLPILKNVQVTRMTLELAPRSPNYHTNRKTFELSTYLTLIAPLHDHDGSLVVLDLNSGQDSHDPIP
ncbi:hypothetical protein TNCV_343731 [Trichonephila clavipes]|nr:hypothetical protein TNCV_343731 [Trichonephila clavipes]